MSSDLWQQAKQALTEAMSLDGQARADFLQRLESQSPELAAEVQSLVAASDSAEEEDFLGMPANSSDLEETVTSDTQASSLAYDAVFPSSEKNLNIDSPVDVAALIAEDYEVQEQIGKGGMGVVYKAYQHSLRRHVALKIIPDRLLRTAAEIARFQIEAEAAASLDHPGIVPVYEVGERFGVHYYSMALIEGGSLAAHVGDKAARLEQRKAAEIIEQVCHAVQYAHDRAVIHRDLKPENILLDKKGHPRLTDFGLAKVLKEDEGLTMTGQVMGTPRYMAPEQATGNQSELSNRTDVYSLGSTLYALLAGRPPFGAETLLQTIKQVAESPPPPLTQFAPNVAPDLQTICEKCLSKRPSDRYESAKKMADDLQCYLDGYPIAARPLGRWTRGYLWCRRNPAVATLLTVTATTLLVATIVSTFFGIQARQQLARAEQNAQKLNQAIEELFVFASENVLADEPGMQLVRKTLLESAQRYYQDLLETGQTSIDKLAQSAFLLGRVQASLGDRQSAANSFETAAANYQELVQANENDSDLLAALAQTFNEHARLGEKSWYARQSGGPREEAMAGLKQWQEHAKQCVFWRNKAVRYASDDQELHRLLANAQMNLGLAITEQAGADHDLNSLSEANHLLQEAQAMRNTLLEKEPDNGRVLRDVALGFAALADMRAVEAELTKENESVNGLWEESLSLRTRAADTLANLPPSAVDADTDWLLATCHQVCAESRFQLGLYEEAITDYQKMLAVMQRLLLQNPRVQRYRTGLAQAQYMLSQLLLATKQGEQGYAFFDACQQTLVEAIAIDPRNQAVIDQLVDFSTSFAGALAEQGLLEQAIQRLDRAKQLLSQVQVRGAGKAAVETAIRQLLKEMESLRQENEKADRVARRAKLLARRSSC